MNDNKLYEYNNISLKDLENIKLQKRIIILKEFLDDETIFFILRNNPNFLNKISIESLSKSSKFYQSLKDFDYASLIKWLPIFLDFDKAVILMSYFTDKKTDDEKIVRILESSILRDFELADVIYENNKIDYNILNDNYIKHLVNLKIQLDKSKVSNETFNNLIDNNIKKYSNLLRKLK